MKDLFKYTKSDKIIKWSLQISGVLILAQLLYTGYSYFSLPQLVPLFNQLPWGEERLGQRFEIFLPCIITLLFLVINFFFMNKLAERMPLTARILAITTLLISVLSFIFTFQTLQLIF